MIRPRVRVHFELVLAIKADRPLVVGGRVDGDRADRRVVGAVRVGAVGGRRQGQRAVRQHRGRARADDPRRADADRRNQETGTADDTERSAGGSWPWQYRIQAFGGFRLLQGGGQFRGEILGGSIDSIFDMFDPARYADMPAICRKYGLFPSAAEWQGKILLLETSEEQMEPAKYRRALEYLKQAGVFAAVSGVLVGKPMDGVWQAEYEKLLLQVIGDPELPVVCGVPVGHALPRCIVPFGVTAQVDVPAQKIEFL